jgi:carboxymethylenebutenolidase
MTEAMAEIATPDGRMDAFVTHPQEGGPFPAVVILMDVWGLREELFDVARKVAAAGYYAVVPNFYYRQGPVRFEFRDERGRMKSIGIIPEEDRLRMREQTARVSDEMAMNDLRSVLDFLHSQPVKPGSKGSIGFCLGGRYALQAAAHYPDDFRATASLHGTRLVTDAPLSPHKFASACRGEIYCGFAEHDALAPPATRNTLDEVFAACPNVRYRYALHMGAKHGYALPDRDIHDKAAANRDWEYIFAMFRRVLGDQFASA